MMKNHILAKRVVNRLYLPLVISGFALFIISLFSPILSVRKLYIFNDTLTIFSMVKTLFQNNEWVLFVVIVCLTIILPIIKFYVLTCYAQSGTRLKNGDSDIRFLEAVSKWAMLDVFLVAIIITIIKLELFSNAQTHYGLYMFSGSVLISIICAQLIKYKDIDETNNC